MKSSRKFAAFAVATAIATLPFASLADDPEEPGVDPVVEPDVWAEITYDDIPAEVTNRVGALIPLDAVAYIQTGLMGHFDAIRNAGIDQPHNPTATEWKNLVSGYPDAAFSANAGHWRRGNSFYFDDSVGHGYARLKSAMNVGDNIAVQLVTDVDYTKQASSGYPIIFHDFAENEFSVFFNNTSGRTSKLYVKADKFGGGASSNRPSLNNWDGRYATVFINTNQQLIAESASVSKARSGSRTKTFNYAFSWFGTGTYNFVGDCHAVRIYNAELTAEQLAWNRMLDEVRYRGVNTNINVIVESNVAGVEANEATGKYMVNGHFTFTAPASVTANGCTYVPTGYTLEVWDSAASRWSTAESHAGETSFTYTNCLARSKVRIIWDWTLQSGVKKYDADSYVQGGLLLNFDGIRNAGLHAPHSTNTTTWANLGSLGYTRDAVRGSVSGNAAGEWVANGYEFRGANYFTSGGTADFGQYLTAQVVTDSSPMWRNTYKRRWPSPIGCTASDNTFLIYGNNYGYLNGKYHFQSQHTSGKTVEISPWNGRFFNVIVSTNTISLSDGEKTGSNTVGTFGYNSDGLTMVVGSSKADDNYVARCFAGRIHAARWYNRVLTANEIKRNNDIDWCRFFGAAGRSGETNLVEVCSERPEIGLDDAGVYIVRGSGSTLTISAPATTNIDGKVYSCDGYRIETWDATAKTWVAPDITKNVTSCTITGTSDGANRRVTWLWTLTHGIRTAADYDVTDYVQTGLVGHFDGIRNQGVDMPSSNVKEALWRNLVTDDPDATITSSSGVWTNGVGFYFTGAATGEYAKMKDPVSLGTNSTVQLVGNVDYRAQGSGSSWYPAVFSDESNNYCIFFRNTTAGTLSTGLEMNADGYGTASNRPKMIPWEGKYMTAVLGTGYSWMFEGVAFSNQKARSEKPVLTKRYAWGGCPQSGFNPGLKGEIDSVRIYNRVLTEAEIAQNRKVDEIRFRGNFADYANLIIATNGAVTASTSIPAGEYELTGSVTITTEQVVENGRHYHPKLCVETWNGSAWVAGAKQDGNTYTATDSERVRLTYTWERRGFMVIVR